MSADPNQSMPCGEFVSGHSRPVPRVRVRTRVISNNEFDDTSELAAERTNQSPSLAIEPPAQPGEYEVGYGKPPKTSRFQAGKSGNPRGRPKGSRSIATLINEALDKPITAKIGNRTVSMKRREALVHRVVEQALGGDLRAFALLMKLDPGGAIADAPSTSSDQGLSPEESSMLEGFLRRVAGDDGEASQ
jgi:hypothetical protein